MSGARGGLALVLHTHMPYVEGFGTWPFGEEWLFEAVACVYLPLLKVLDGAPVTVGLTPVLCDQLEALRGDAGERFLAFLREVRAPIHEMDASGLDRGGEREMAAEVRRAAGDYVAAERDFLAVDRDLVAAFGALRGPALWTSSASHAVLPLLATDAGVRLQVHGGVAAHERRFGSFGGGFWLPECAYEPGLERDLSEHGVLAFCVDQTAAYGAGAPEHLRPVATDAGPVAVPIDWKTISLVWDDSAGYPTHGAYRNYHGRTTHDLKPWNIDGRPYRHEDARALAREHGRDFARRVARRIDAAGGGLVCCALDTELLGHWWYEGQEWLRAVLREAPAHGVDLVTLPEALDRFPAEPGGLLASTWGTPKDLTTWDAPRVAEICFEQRRAEIRTVTAAARAQAGAPALARAARELLALQASDWAFLHTRELAADYPIERARAHAGGVDAALRALADSAAVPDPALRNLAPDLDLAALTVP
ncbi:MAG TPA: 1,4-alpha-glucan branching protein domain-containing protein [Thermoleophilaceae bacterium]|nr:1,4-alpha-glucan branching protein domain-containing protein [Thermoleophilaceae bacterium]